MTREPDRRAHWDRVYASRQPGEVSWYQPSPDLSLAMIGLAGADPKAGAIDVGAGASRLAARLLDAGYQPVTVLDVSPQGLRRLREELGERAAQVEFVEADVTQFRPRRRYGLWHDRAVFHFLTEPGDRRAYVETLRATLEPGGAAVIATFAPDGPERCSGLPVRRHDAESLAAELGPDFMHVESRREVHRTPAGVEQRFGYHLFRRR